jgi:hypothetical protein
MPIKKNDVAAKPGNKNEAMNKKDEKPISAAGKPAQKPAQKPS